MNNIGERLELMQYLKFKLIFEYKSLNILFNEVN